MNTMLAVPPALCKSKCKFGLYSFLLCDRGNVNPGYPRPIRLGYRFRGSHDPYAPGLITR